MPDAVLLRLSKASEDHNHLRAGQRTVWGKPAISASGEYSILSERIYFLPIIKILIWIIAILHFQYRGQPVELGYFAFREFIGQCCLKQLIFAFNHFEIRIAQFLYLAEMTKLRCSNSQSLHGSTFVECPWYFFIHLPKQFQQPLIYTAVIVLNRKNIMVVYLITQDGFEEPVLGQAWAVAKLLQFLLKFRAKFEVGVFRHP